MQREELFDRAKARGRGQSVALVAFGLVLVAGLVVHPWLAERLGDELAGLIGASIGIFVIAGIFHFVPDRWALIEARRFCSRSGHVLAHQVAADGRSLSYCRRCGAALVGERVHE